MTTKEILFLTSSLGMINTICCTLTAQLVNVCFNVNLTLLGSGFSYVTDPNGYVKSEQQMGIKLINL